MLCRRNDVRLILCRLFRLDSTFNLLIIKRDIYSERARLQEKDIFARALIFTFYEHPEEIGQMEVMEEDDDDAGSLVRLSSVEL